jgi:hypothetical protein
MHVGLYVKCLILLPHLIQNWYVYTYFRNTLQEILPRHSQILICGQMDQVDEDRGHISDKFCCDHTNTQRKSMCLTFPCLKPLKLAQSKILAHC